MAKRPGCCCFLLLLLGLVGAAVAAFILWARPPSIDFKGVAPPEKNIPAFEMKELDNFRFNLRLNFTVKNPNYVGATLTSIQAKVSALERSLMVRAASPKPPRCSWARVR